MRYILTVALILSFQQLSLSQTINYEIVKDEPVEPKISINLDLFNMDMNTGIPNIRLDNISMNLGVFGYVKIVDRLDIDFNIHKSWLTLGKLGFKEYSGNLELNAGVNLWLSKQEVTKNTKVVLKQTENRSTGSVTTTYITLPAKQLKRFGVRAGLYSKMGPFNYRDYTDGEGSSSIEETNISSFGLSAGVNSRNVSNIVITDEVYGKSMKSRGRDLYFDALIIPFNSFKDPNNSDANITETVKNFESTLPVGFRVGYRIFQVEQKSITGKKFGVSGIGEFGYKPYQGWFLTAGFGLTLVKM